MAQEAVLAIKRAESDANSIIENAEKEAVMIVENAENTAKQMIEDFKNSLKADYETAVLSARCDSDAMTNENVLKNQQNAGDLEKKLLNNKEKAIDEVLKKVLEG